MSVRLFRAVPTRIAAVGAVWLAKFVVARALASGSDAFVTTLDPGPWQGLGERLDGSGALTVAPPAHPRPHAPATPDRPVLIVDDLDPAAGSVAMPWRSQLTLLRQLTPAGVSVLKSADLVLVQRLTAAEAALAGSAFKLTDQSSQLLQELEPDMLALIGGGADRYIWLDPTSAERREIGVVRP
ncbi:hypothetical protein [Dactylosporangium sp. CA-092794]|uniref:hypothetical protein n=1 Tax=Dactylosporangium sp. CA-092794 TaxID=3239929 RepID=UPI003D8BF1FE